MHLTNSQVFILETKGVEQGDDANTTRKCWDAYSPSSNSFLSNTSERLTSSSGSALAGSTLECGSGDCLLVLLASGRFPMMFKQMKEVYRSGLRDKWSFIFICITCGMQV